MTNTSIGFRDSKMEPSPTGDSPSKEWYQNPWKVGTVVVGSLVLLIAAAYIWGKPVEETRQAPKLAAPAAKPAETKPESTPAPQPQPAPSPTPAPEVEQAPAPAPVAPAAPTYDGGDKDCSDFATQAAAQAYFKSKGGSPTNNVDRLDRDHDGIACENN